MQENVDIMIYEFDIVEIIVLKCKNVRWIDFFLIIFLNIEDSLDLLK